MKGVRVFVLAAALAAAFALPAPALADNLVLRSGKTLRIEALECDRATCRAQVKGGEVVLAATEVLRVEAEEIVDPEPVPASPSGNVTGARSVEQIVAEAARTYALPVSLVRAVARIESANNPGAVSPKGAQGVMQLMPATARSLGVRDSFDPEQNIPAGARLLRSLLEKYDGRVAEALAAYNAGEGAVTRHGGVPPYPETRGYIRKVVREYEKPAKAGAAPAATPVSSPAPSASPGPRR